MKPTSILSAVLRSVLLAVLHTPLAHADEITAFNNSVAMSNCILFDATGEMKPNPKNGACKVTLNSPGEKETRITYDTTVNVGTLLHPQEEARHVEIRGEKANGKISKFESSVTSAGSKKADTFSFELGADGSLMKGRASQFGQNYALISQELCQPLKPTIESYGKENLANCSVLLQKMAGSLKTLQSELQRDSLKVGFTYPSRMTPSLNKMVAMNPDRMIDTTNFIMGCTQLFANEAAAKAAPETGAAKPTANPAGSAQ